MAQRRLRPECGQVQVSTAIITIILLAVVALVAYLGAWYMYQADHVGLPAHRETGWTGL